MATKKGATEGEGQKFKLPEIKLLTMTVPIRGLTALLTNRIPDWLADDMEIKNQGGDPEKRLRTPNEQFEEANPGPAAEDEARLWAQSARNDRRAVSAVLGGMVHASARRIQRELYQAARGGEALSACRVWLRDWLLATG
jgi:hypothetical protein